MSNISGPVAGGQEILSHLLDSECDPANPYVIELHCRKIQFSWERAIDGRWEGNEWIPSTYIFTDFMVTV